MLICSGVQTDSTLQSYLCFHIMQAYKISFICLWNERQFRPRILVGMGKVRWHWAISVSSDTFLSFLSLWYTPPHLSFPPHPPQILPTEYISHGGIWSVAYSIHVLVRVTNFKICKYERQRAWGPLKEFGISFSSSVSQKRDEFGQ